MATCRAVFVAPSFLRPVRLIVVAILLLPPCWAGAMPVTICNKTNAELFAALLEQARYTLPADASPPNNFPWLNDGAFHRVAPNQCLTVYDNQENEREARDFYFYAFRRDGKEWSGGKNLRNHYGSVLCLDPRDSEDPSAGYTLEPLNLECGGTIGFRKVAMRRYGSNQRYVAGYANLTLQGEGQDAAPLRPPRPRTPAVAPTPGQPNTTTATNLNIPGCPSGQFACVSPAGTRCFNPAYLQCSYGILCRHSERACPASYGVGGCYDEAQGYVCRSGRVCKGTDTNCR